MRVQRSLCVLLAISSLASALGAQDMERAKKLFLTNCAACHGESGDGKGTTQLDRPARSFMDGGFSFGNTPEALFKTISTGIPGSPMAGFDSSLTEEERHLVAAYVVTLGPPITEVSEADMILAVKDEPVIVRGLLPSLGEGLPQTPRGLLIGDPSGITFEYRVDDVRLLALRQGGFVKRTDWTGRGGTPLEPLGKVVHLVEGGKPEPVFSLKGQPLTTRLSGTRLHVAGKQVYGDSGPHFASAAPEIDYHVANGAREVAHAHEIPMVLTESIGTGYQRSIWFDGVADEALNVALPIPAKASVLAKGDNQFGAWAVVQAEGGPVVCLALEEDGAKLDAGKRLEATLSLKKGKRHEGVTLIELVLVGWTPGMEKVVARWWEER
jgi:mono/diheme cytochrome c family protein